MTSYKCTLRSDGTGPQALRKVEASSEVQQPRVDDVVLYPRFNSRHNVSKRTMSGKGGGAEEGNFPDLFLLVLLGAPPMGKKI